MHARNASRELHAKFGRSQRNTHPTSADGPHPDRDNLSTSDADSSSTATSGPPDKHRRTASRPMRSNCRPLRPKPPKNTPFKRGGLHFGTMLRHKPHTTARIVPTKHTFAPQTFTEHQRGHAPPLRRKTPPAATSHSSPTMSHAIPPCFFQTLIFRGFQATSRDTLRGIACKIWGGLSGTCGIDGIDVNTSPISTQQLPTPP